MLAIENSRDGRIVTVTLNRPDRRNALNQSVVLELTRVVDSLSQDDFVRVIILTGAGDVFSAGADLEALSALKNASFEKNLEDSNALAVLFKSMRESPKVIVGMVNGHAIAGGSGLVAACDVSFASNKAKLGFTEVRIGFVPALVSVLLRTRISETGLRDILLSGRLFSADEARTLGLVTYVFPELQLKNEVWGYAETLCRNTSASSIASTKELLIRTSEQSFGAALDEAATLNARARESADCKAGIEAFLAKEDAPWVVHYDNDHTDPA